MGSLLSLVLKSTEQVWLSFQHNWPFLVLSVVIATVLKLFINTEQISVFLNRYRRAGVIAATTAAVATPFCSCGTMAVVLGMLASTMPWAPIVAFMVASPLTSPGELIYSAGLFGWPFALAFFLASIVLGLAGGFIAAMFERRGWLAHQARFAKPESSSCGSSKLGLAAQSKSSVTLTALVLEFFTIGKRLLPMFLGFAFIGYFLNGLIPAHWVAAIFGSGNAFSIPLAATMGLPLYINSEASLPLIRALLDNGMSPSAALAFVISGAGTSIGAIMGTLTIARWRVVALVVGVLWIGAMVSGLTFEVVLMMGDA